MPHWFKPDTEKTRQAYADGVLCDKKKRSFYSLPITTGRKGNEHLSVGTTHWILFGVDVVNLRGEILNDWCKCRKNWGTELDHIISKGRGGCSCRENLQWLCVPCHRKKHVRVKWSKRMA